MYVCTLALRTAQRVTCGNVGPVHLLRKGIYYETSKKNQQHRVSKQTNGQRDIIHRRAHTRTHTGTKNTDSNTTTQLRKRPRTVRNSGKTNAEQTDMNIYTVHHSTHHVNYTNALI